MNTPFAASILVIEDDPLQIRLYAQALAGYRLTCVSSATAALDFLKQQSPDLILLDNLLKNGEVGLDFLPRLKDAAAHVPVIVISGTPGQWIALARRGRLRWPGSIVWFLQGLPR